MKQLDEMLEHVGQFADRVQEETRAANEVITRVNEALAEREVGVEVWLPEILLDAQATSDSFQVGLQLGYARVGSRWQLAVRDASVTDGEWRIDEDEDALIALSAADRLVRIQAREVLPDLLKLMAQDREEFVTKVTDFRRQRLERTRVPAPVPFDRKAFTE